MLTLSDQALINKILSEDDDKARGRPVRIPEPDPKIVAKAELATRAQRRALRVWEESWLFDYANGTIYLKSKTTAYKFPKKVIGAFGFTGGHPLAAPARTELAAAAPAMARVLCQVEFQTNGQCRSCNGKGHSHKKACELDAALTEAGLDAAARKHARKDVQ